MCKKALLGCKHNKSQKNSIDGKKWAQIFTAKLN